MQSSRVLEKIGTTCIFILPDNTYTVFTRICMKQYLELPAEDTVQTGQRIRQLYRDLDLAGTVLSISMDPRYGFNGSP